MDWTWIAYEIFNELLFGSSWSQVRFLTFWSAQYHRYSNRVGRSKPNRTSLRKFFSWLAYFVLILKKDSKAQMTNAHNFYVKWTLDQNIFDNNEQLFRNTMAVSDGPTAGQNLISLGQNPWLGCILNRWVQNADFSELRAGI